MLLVMQALAQLLVHSVVLVRRCRWSPLTVVLVLLVLRLTSQVLVHCLMGDSLRRIRGCRVLRSRGMAFLCEYRGQVRATGCRIGLLLVLSDLCLLVV